jgi:hypothetical protein
MYIGRTSAEFRSLGAKFARPPVSERLPRGGDPPSVRISKW